MDYMVFPAKDPDAKLDYKFDWAAKTNGNGQTDWLSSGETITSYTITADSGITVESSILSDSNTSVVVWVSGGTEAERYKITCRINTSLGRTDDRTAIIPIAQR